MPLSQLGFAIISIVAILSEYKIAAIITVNIIFAIVTTYLTIYSINRIVGGIDRLKKYMDGLMSFAFFKTNRIKKAEYIKNDDIGFILRELSTENRMEDGKFIIEGHHEQINTISDSLAKRLLENGMPQAVIESLRGKEAQSA